MRSYEDFITDIINNKADEIHPPEIVMNCNEMANNGVNDLKRYYMPLYFMNSISTKPQHSKHDSGTHTTTTKLVLKLLLIFLLLIN